MQSEELQRKLRLQKIGTASVWVVDKSFQCFFAFFFLVFLINIYIYIYPQDSDNSILVFLFFFF